MRGLSSRAGSLGVPAVRALYPIEPTIIGLVGGLTGVPGVRPLAASRARAARVPPAAGEAGQQAPRFYLPEPGIVPRGEFLEVREGAEAFESTRRDSCPAQFKYLDADQILQPRKHRVGNAWAGKEQPGINATRQSLQSVFGKAAFKSQ